MLSVDGSYGEGGGQILRTALSLAALTGVPVRIERIRARRSKPGLRPQHLTAVQAVARVSQAEVTGVHLGSQALTFRPRTPQGGHYLFDVARETGSAGAVTLVAQALLPPLLKAGAPATVILKGGTHVPWSPPAHYLSHVFLPALAAMGAEVEMTLERWGWYPRGGGEMRLTIRGARPLSGVQWHTPAASSAFRALSAAAKLPEHVARRQAARLAARLDATVPVEIIPAGGQDPGSLVFLWGPQAGFTALGVRGKPAEQSGGRSGGGLPGLPGQRRRPGPPPGRPNPDLPGPGPGALQVHHRGRHLASDHQRLGYRAVFRADFSD